MQKEMIEYVVLLMLSRTYKPWIGNLPSKAIELLWTLAKFEITSEILSVERVRHFVFPYQQKQKGPCCEVWQYSQ